MTTKGYEIGGFSNESMDIDANGEYIYLAVLNNSFPRVLKIKSNLGEDATVEFQPDDGNFINLQCGDYSASIIYAAGNFGDYRTVRYDGDRGIYWYSADEGYFYGIARPIHVGPSNDNLVLIGLPDIDELKEAYFLAEDGPYWITRGENLPFDIRSFDRLDIDPAEIVIGVDDTDPYWYDWTLDNYWYEVEQSWNTGYQFVDISGELWDKGVAITSVLII